MRIIEAHKRILNNLPDDFVSTWDTTKAGSATDRIVLPLLASGTYNFNVYYQGSLVKTISTYTDNEVIFTDGTGVKEITIVGQLEGFKFKGNIDKDKIIRLDSFGSGFKVKSIQFCEGCSNLEYVGSGLDVSGETDLANWFRYCYVLTQIDGIENWDVSNVARFLSLFEKCYLLNPDVTNWDVSSSNNMQSMFRGTLMDRDIGSWNVSSVTSMTIMFLGGSLSTANYDLLLCGWSLLTLQSSVNFHAGTAKYSASSQSCRDILTGTYLWTITDSGQV